MPKFPKLGLLCHLFNRPTVGQAIAEAIKLVLKEDPNFNMEATVLLCRKDLAKELKEETT